MQWSEKRFFFEIKPLLSRYRAENKWFSSWKDDDEDILNAWNLYVHANEPHLDMLLLGDTKIRKDPRIVASFGLSSGGGVQEDSEKTMVKMIDEARKDLNVGKAADAHHPKVVGKGGILSDKHWTPLLNDAFMLGGIHGRRDFALAEEDYSTYFASHVGESVFQARRAVFEHGHKKSHESPVLKWEDFFRNNKAIVWNGFPRVFARELAGLKAFGYEPRFRDSQLSFQAGGGGRSAGASFVAYLNVVAKAGISPPSEKTCLGGISEYLFHRNDAFEKPLQLA